LLFLALFIFFSLLLFGRREKKGFSSFARGRLYACVCARTSKKASVGGYCRQRDMQRKKTFAGSRLGKIKKSTTVSVSHAEIEERERKRREEASSIHYDVVLKKFLFLSLKISYIKKAVGE
jgi:hypothetical protein